MTRDNHEKMRLIRKRVEAGMPMTGIAFELGEDVDALCAFIMAYKTPRRQPYLRKSDGPIPARPQPTRPSQRFLNWKRAHDGAAKARAEL